MHAREVGQPRFVAAGHPATAIKELAGASPATATCPELYASTQLQYQFLAAIAARSNNALYTRHELENIARGYTELICLATRNTSYVPWSDVLAQTVRADGFQPGDPTINGPIKPLSTNLGK